MKTKRTLLTLCLLLTLLTAKADKIRGISVESPRKEIVVLLNGQQMCESANSCFIANLHPGTYSIQVFYADEMRRPLEARRLLYYDQLRYTGRGVHHIRIPSRGHYERPGVYPSPGVMDHSTFRDFCQSLKRQSFDEDKENMIKALHPSLRFTSLQCKEIVEICSFDETKVKVLKKLYPRVVDPGKFYLAIDALSFSSSKTKVFNFIEKYNRKNH